jgi:hypothetical protein
MLDRSDWTQAIVQHHCIQGRGIGNMLTAESMVGSGRVPPRGGGNDKLNPAESSCECGGPALDLLPGAIAVPVGSGPGGGNARVAIALLVRRGPGGAAAMPVSDSVRVRPNITLCQVILLVSEYNLLGAGGHRDIATRYSWARWRRPSLSHSHCHESPCTVRDSGSVTIAPCQRLRPGSDPFNKSWVRPARDHSDSALSPSPSHRHCQAGPEARSATWAGLGPVPARGQTVRGAPTRTWIPRLSSEP